MLKNTHQEYGLITRLLHWLMAILLIGLFILGLYMTSLDYYDPLYHKAPWWHKSIGLLVMLLLMMRLIWKLVSPGPVALKSHSRWEVRLAHIVQNLFYLLIFLIGVTGFFISTAEGKGIEFFTFFKVPALTNKLNEEIADLIGDTHLVLAITLAVLVGLHTAAALKHHFIDRDDTLRRMLDRP